MKKIGRVREWEIAKHLVFTNPSKYRFRVDRKEWGTMVFLEFKVAESVFGPELKTIQTFFWKKG